MYLLPLLSISLSLSRCVSAGPLPPPRHPSTQASISSYPAPSIASSFPLIFVLCGALCLFISLSPHFHSLALLFHFLYRYFTPLVSLPLLFLFFSSFIFCPFFLSFSLFRSLAPSLAFSLLGREMNSFIFFKLITFSPVVLI